jgi:hypothetical protein
MGILFVISWLASPFTYQGATLLHARFLGPAWALLAITAAPRSVPSRLAKICTACLPLGMALLSWPQFVDSDQSSRHLDEIMALIPINSSVALAAVDHPLYKTRVYSAATGPARTVAIRGGRASTGLFISPLSPVQIRQGYRWNELDVRTLLGGSMHLMPAHDLVRFSWVIAQSRDPSVRDQLVIAFQPDAEWVATSGEWMLFRSKHPQLPMTSPDSPPRAVGDTVLDRVNYLRFRAPSPSGQPLPWQIRGGAPR